MELMPLRLRIAAQSDAFSDIELSDSVCRKVHHRALRDPPVKPAMIRAGFTADLLSLQRRTGDMRQLPDQAARLSFGICKMASRRTRY
jgi:hypothetical protein